MLGLLLRFAILQTARFLFIKNYEALKARILFRNFEATALIFFRKPPTDKYHRESATYTPHTERAGSLC